MILRTPGDFGALIRDRRKALKLGQQELAAQVGVSRQWIIDVEKGKPRAEIGLLLRTLDALGVALDAASESSQPGPRSAKIDLDAILASARGRK